MTNQTPSYSVVTEAMIERLRQILKRATPLPWAWEQCGEKEDAPVVGVIVDGENQPLAGCIECYNEDGTERGYYRETIAYEWQHCDGHSASANADFVVEAVNALPALLDEIERLQSANTTGSDELVPMLAQRLEEAWLARGYGEGDQWNYLAKTAINAMRGIAIATPDTDRVAVLTEALERIQDEANTVGPDWRETASMIDSICIAALSQPLGSQER